MQIFGKSFSEYVRFEKVILLLILVVGVARLALSLGGVPNSTARWLSITAVSFIGLVYVSITVQTNGFGSYKQLLPLVFIQTALAHLIVVGAIVLAMQTARTTFLAPPSLAAERGAT